MSCKVDVNVQVACLRPQHTLHWENDSWRGAGNGGGEKKAKVKAMATGGFEEVRPQFKLQYNQ